MLFRFSIILIIVIIVIPIFHNINRVHIFPSKYIANLYYYYYKYYPNIRYNIQIDHPIEKSHSTRKPNGVITDKMMSYYRHRWRPDHTANFSSPDCAKEWTNLCQCNIRIGENILLFLEFEYICIHSRIFLVYYY